MKAALIESFGQPIHIRNVPDPTPDSDSVVLRVQATGICRSDWHGWLGHDPDVRLPHVPGHELAGIVEETGTNIRRWRKGARVTLPFVCGCGRCPQCLGGNQQICDSQFQPGFTHWGSFAPFVEIKYADHNLVALPEQIDFVAAASLGCRFATSFRGVVAQGRVTGGNWVAVHGCGGVGLSAIMIAHALGAMVIAIDIDDEVLGFARTAGAAHTINAKKVPAVVEAVKDISHGGVHVSIDALGSLETCFNSIACLRKQGRHVQIGLMVADESTPPVPMAMVISKELEIYGSHGMQAYKYDDMLAMILSGKLDPTLLVKKTVNLKDSLHELEKMGEFGAVGITVIDSFDV